MRVILTLPTDGEASSCGVVAELADDGRVVMSEHELGFRQMAVSPFFYAPRAMPQVLLLQVQDEQGQVVQQCALRVSGASGRLTLVDRTARVRPELDAGRYAAESKVARSNK